MTAEDLASSETVKAALAVEPYTVPPPISMLPTITASISTACAAVPKDKSGALIGQADETGVRGVVVERIGEDFAIIGWIGSGWKADSLSYGAAFQLTW